VCKDTTTTIIASKEWCLVVVTIDVGVFNFLVLVKKVQMNSWWWFLFVLWFLHLW
jgi:hypothetical protein